MRRDDVASTAEFLRREPAGQSSFAFSRLFETSYQLFCTLSLLLFHTASSSNPFSHHRGRDLLLPKAFFLRQFFQLCRSLLYCRWYGWMICNFTSFQQYFSQSRTMGVQWKAVYGWKDFRLERASYPGSPD